MYSACMGRAALRPFLSAHCGEDLDEVRQNIARCTGLVGVRHGAIAADAEASRWWPASGKDCSLFRFGKSGASRPTRKIGTAVPLSALRTFRLHSAQGIGEAQRYQQATADGFRKISSFSKSSVEGAQYSGA